MLQPAPSPLAHSRSSPAADARPLYATVLAVAGNAAGMCSGTVLCIGMINVFNHILVSVGILQNIFIHFCIVQSSFLFVSFQVLAVGHWSYCLLCYCQLWHAVTVSLSTCPTAFTGRRLSSCRIPSVAVPRSLCVSSDTYHYSSFHNYLMITVTYNLSDNGI